MDGSTPSTIRGAGQEFSATSGGWQLDSQASLNSGGTNTWPSLTPAASGELYFGWAYDSGSATGGSTPGYSYFADGNGNGLAYNVSCAEGRQPPRSGATAA